jgi:alkylation response protein AidB-like acyl-CoA dehydrogenase
MPDTTFLAWPFFADHHRSFAKELRTWAEQTIPPLVASVHGHDLDAAHATSQPGASGTSALDDTCRTLVKRMGSDGWLRYLVPKQYGGVYDAFDVRTLCLMRETFASVSGLADFSFAMQGLGSGPITLFGSDALKDRYLPRLATGAALSAFAISEADAGSDVAAMTTTARRDGDTYIIDGEKTWISNAGIADYYIVFCRLDPSQSQSTEKKEYAAFVVDADTPGLTVSKRFDVIAPHPIGTLTFAGCRVKSEAMLGEPGKGLKVALGTLDVFRTTVGAAALGFARRALDESLAYVTARHAFGQPLSEFQLTRARIAAMASDVDTSALLVYRAAWTRDSGAPRITREAAMAKWQSTEAAQRVIDSAVQLLGGRGVLAGAVTEQLYREIRALRIYEGTSEIQQLVIAGQVLSAVQ